MLRPLKQVIIFLIYFALVMSASVIVYYVFIKAPETCFDGIKNENEKKIDCGGVCQAGCQEVITGADLIVKESAFVTGNNGQYDILVKIYNPNDEVGASSFSYTLTLQDATGTILATRSGKNYILPQENKYLLHLNVDVASVPTTVVLQVDSIEWARFSGYQEKPTINIYQKRYNQISSGAGFSEAYGLLSNESPYDFRTILVYVILRDAGDRPLAFNSTEMYSVQSHEERDFRLVWPSAFLGTVEKVEMEVDADVYHSDNFMRQYLPSGKFQEFTSPSAY